YLKTLEEQGVYKIGVERAYFKKTIEKGSLDPEYFGPVLFNNYEAGEFLMMKPSIISLKTLKQELIKEGVLQEADKIPGPVEKIYKQSLPKFKTQSHFYGYD
ncbi:phosphofructokinase, partial [Desulfobacteraceae bacterium SEEP-SAG9]